MRGLAEGSVEEGADGGGLGRDVSLLLPGVEALEERAAHERTCTWSGGEDKWRCVPSCPEKRDSVDRFTVESRDS